MKPIGRNTVAQRQVRWIPEILSDDGTAASAGAVGGTDIKEYQGTKFGSAGRREGYH